MLQGPAVSYNVQVLYLLETMSHLQTAVVVFMVLSLHRLTAAATEEYDDDYSYKYDSDDYDYQYGFNDSDYYDYELLPPFNPNCTMNRSTVSLREHAKEYGAELHTLSIKFSILNSSHNKGYINVFHIFLRLDIN